MKIKVADLKRAEPSILKFLNSSYDDKAIKYRLARAYGIWLSELDVINKQYDELLSELCEPILEDGKQTGRFLPTHAFREAFRELSQTEIEITAEPVDMPIDSIPDDVSPADIASVFPFVVVVAGDE